MKILIFIGLKIVELSVFLFIPYFVGLFVKKIKWSFLYDELNSCGVLLLWFTGAVLLFVAVVIAGLVVELIEANWELAGMLIN